MGMRKMVPLVIALAVVLGTTGCTKATAPDTSSIFETYASGGNVLIRTDCPGADDVLRSPLGDGLPRKGQTEKQRVETVLAATGDDLVNTFGAIATDVVPRSGQVWSGPKDGEYTIEEAADYMIGVTLETDAPCPAAPYSWEGIPVVFFRA